MRPSSPADRRKQLLRAGYMPLPVVTKDKRPPLENWSKKTETNDAEIELWSTMFPQAQSTGLLTIKLPTLDLDIMDEPAAEAAEGLVRERFEERGHVLVRFGRLPKRAIPFRTNDPFDKILISLLAPNGDAAKIELLANGQQVVCFGLHKETNKPYRWHGGEPGDIQREDLPYIHEEEAQQLVDDIADLLCRDFGYQRAKSRPKKQRQANGDDTGGGSADWGYLVENIRAGRELHDSLRDLSAKLVRSGMNAGAAVNFLRGLMDEIPEGVRDKRWKDRRAEIPRLVESAQGQKDEKPIAPVEPCTLAEVHQAFGKWFGKDYDFATLNAMLAVAASERLPGDPAWLLIISGSGNAKTETVQATSGLGAHVVSTITSDAALLSASPRKQRAKNATGGLLRKIGKRGILAVKDVTSILSMDRNTRATVLAALREVHDGRWVRNVGVDGGQSLAWEGRIVVIGACTTAWDQAHSVIATMGDRFVVIRSDSHVGRVGGGLQAMRNTGSEQTMRKELSAAVAGVVSSVKPNEVYDLSEEDMITIVRAADVVTLARTGVELDYRGDVIDAHAPEMPTRLAKQLCQIMRGAIAIGMSHGDALQLVIRCARDSMPQLRLQVLRDIAEHPESGVMQVRRRLQKPRATTDRALQALHILGLLTCREEETERGGQLVQQRHYRLGASISLAPLVFG